MQLRDTEQANDINALVLQSALNREAITAALVLLITVRRLPFRIVEWPEFHAFCQVLNPEVEGYITTTHSTVNKMVRDTFVMQKDVVRKKLQSAISKVHLSLDIWTSPNRHLLLGVCAHFVDRNERLQRGLLALRTTLSHSGEEQFQTLLPILQDYGIVQRLGAIVADNASTNDVLCRTIQKYLQEDHNIEWKSLHQRIRCNGHIIHLAVEAFLFQDLVQEDELLSYDIEDEKGVKVNLDSRRNQFRTLGALGKLHNIVVHTRSSPGHTRDFITLAQRRIPLDNRTRWNSWHQMLQVALELESAIDLYTKKHAETLGEDFLTPQDWTTLRTTHDFLQIFKRVTLETQGHDATISNVLFSMDILVRHFKQSLVRNLLLLLLKVLLTSYDRNVIRRIASFVLGFKLDGRCLINTTLSQMNPHYTLRQLSFILNVVRSISKQIGKRSGRKLHLKRLNNSGRITDRKLLGLRVLLLFSHPGCCMGKLGLNKNSIRTNGLLRILISTTTISAILQVILESFLPFNGGAKSSSAYDGHDYRY